MSIGAQAVPTGVQLLIVAAGGAGGGNGSRFGGGGGAGGLLYYANAACGGKTPNGAAIAISTTTIYSISVGTSSGANSAAFGFTAFGGGYGATAGYDSDPSGGGSGGGGVLQCVGLCYGYNGGNGTAGQGNAGGSSSGFGSSGSGAGGGGASTVGGSVGTNGGVGGNGGAGYTMSITGSAVGYAGGGGGGVQVNGPSPGTATHGGGRGGSHPSVGAYSGTSNTGGGGGGGGVCQTGGSGGSGVVVLVYPSCIPNITYMSGSTLVANCTTAPSIPTPCTVNKAGYKIYKFTAGSGSIGIGYTVIASPSLISGATNSGANITSLAYLATIPANTLLLAHFGIEMNSTTQGNITSVTGGGLTWTKLTSVNFGSSSPGQSAHLWYATNTNAQSAFTVSWTNSTSYDDMVVALSAWSGVKTASPFVGSAITSFSVSSVTPSLTLNSSSQAGTTHVVWAASAESAGTSPNLSFSGSGATQVAYPGTSAKVKYEYGYLGYKQQTLAGSYSYTAAASVPHTAIGVILNPA